MAESESCEARRVKDEERNREHQNGRLEVEDDEDDDEEEEEEDDLLEEPGGVSRLGEFQGAASSSDAQLRQAQSETLEVRLTSSNDPCGGLQVNSTSETQGGAELKGQIEASCPEILPSATVQCAEAQKSVCPPSSPESSPISVAPCGSSAPDPMPEQSASEQKVNRVSIPEAKQLSSSDIKKALVPIVRTPISDGYNWRKYGQKQVKSPTGSRSYYKCTYSDCRAKKIECSDHTGHIIEIVNKGLHNHDPPRKNSCTRESRVVSSSGPLPVNSIPEQQARVPNDSDPSTSSKESTPEANAIPERKRQHTSGSDCNSDVQIKEENLSEQEPKRRAKKDNATCSNSVLKPGKKPKFVVHAAGDVGISGDGYRWRKYGQKMVKGNPNPRNYYRCTSAGCPVRKHIETAVDNTSAVIITYKGVHDHDMPVPKKRHGPPSAPLVAAAAPASMNNMQFKKTDAVQNQIKPTQWSVGTEGELTGEALDLGGEKAMESARTLLSIGFEIKPC